MSNPNRGPRAGSRTIKHSSVDTAAKSWGSDMPDEIRVLAQKCDEIGAQASAAKVLGVSGAMVSQALSNRYTGSYANLFALITGAWMGRKVVCPVLGEIAGVVCEKNQKVSDPQDAQALRLFRACRSGCSHSQIAAYAHVKKGRSDDE